MVVLQQPLWVIGFGDGVGSCSLGSAQVQSLQAPPMPFTAMAQRLQMSRTVLAGLGASRGSSWRRNASAFPGWFCRDVLRAAHWRGFEASCKSDVGARVTLFFPSHCCLQS